MSGDAVMKAAYALREALASLDLEHEPDACAVVLSPRAFAAMQRAVAVEYRDVDTRALRGNEIALCMVPFVARGTREAAKWSGVIVRRGEEMELPPRLVAYMQRPLRAGETEG